VSEWSDAEERGCLALFTFMAILIGFLVFCCWANQVAWKQDVVKRGYAEYNSTTGAWQWKEKP